MEYSSIESLVEEGESETLEFKKSSASLKSAAETLCAFLNSGGGRVLIGVSNNKKIIGQHVTDQTKIMIANTLRKFEPTANIDVTPIKTAKNKHILLLTAHPDKRSMPYTFNGRAYEREQSSTTQMPQNKYQQLLLARNLNPSSWESQLAVDFSLDKLDHQEIRNTFEDILRNRRLETSVESESTADILKRLRLFENNQLTHAAVVLFAKEIPANYMQCVIRMAKFRGIEKGNFIDSKHVFGNAFQILRAAEMFITKHAVVASHFEKSNLARVDEPEYPFQATREALINAISHRDYASPGGSITLTLFDDRLEIANTGLLPAVITLTDLKKPHISHPRNPLITNVFFRRGFIEAMGIGTQEIFNACQRAKVNFAT